MKIILGIIFVLGICVAMSDGPYVPLANLIGLWISGSAGILTTAFE